MKANVLIHLTIGLLLLSLITIAGADTFTVDRFDDTTGATNCSVFIPNDCSLRGAIIKANQDTAEDLIYLPAATYTLTLVGIYEDAAAQGDLDITEDLQITGLHGGATIDGNSLDRVFQIMDNIDVTLKELTITGGQTSGLAGTGGGGIMNSGTLNLHDCTLTGNSTHVVGGAIYNYGGWLALHRTIVSANGSETRGGGIFNDITSTLIITDSTIGTANTASGRGGGLFNDGTAFLARTTVNANSTQDGGIMSDSRGAGIYNEGTIEATNCSLMNNWANDDIGGAIYNRGSLNLTYVSFRDNFATSGDAIAYGPGGQTALSSTLIVGFCTNGGGTVTSVGRSLESPSNTCSLTGPFDQVNVVDAMTEVEDFGAGTTIALLQGSPAIDQGDTATCPDTDQRHVDRPINGDGSPFAYCDIGAYEYHPGQPLFSDGFEDGDTSAWSSQTP
ncbi:MAG: hypothetical protein DRJ65_15040 [Acidobacteria bacterium]|nr:MAG: hypothetical protein DRJ65_15040 [Acidobacteriota bacterium]